MADKEEKQKVKAKPKAKAKPKNKGMFSKDRQPKPRGPAKRTMIIEALKAQNKTEQQFWEAVVQKALFGGSDGDGDAQMMALVSKKLFPDSRATYEEYTIELKPGGSRLQWAEAVMQSAMSGSMPIDVAERFLSSLADVAKVEEVDSILERLAILEASIKHD